MRFSKTAILAYLLLGNPLCAKAGFFPLEYGDIQMNRKFLGSVEERQKNFAPMLQKNGAACIQGWDQFAGEYPNYLKELVPLATQAGDELQTFIDRATGPLDVRSLSQSDACAGSLQAFAKVLSDKLAIVDSTYNSFKEKQDQLWSLKDRVTRRYRDDAGKNFQKNSDCKSLSRYQDSVQKSVGSGYAFGLKLINSENGFNVAYRSVVGSRKQMEVEHQRLVDFQARVQNSLKKCGAGKP